MSYNFIFFCQSLAKGGAERVILSLAEHLKRDGYGVKIVTRKKVDEEYSLPDGIDRVTLDEKGVFAEVKALRRECKNFDCDVLVSFLNLFHGLFATFGLKTKNVVSVRNDPKKTYSGLKRLIAKAMLPFVDGCVFQTTEQAEFFPKRLRKKSVIIANPVGDEYFFVTRAPEPDSVVSIGRLTDQKNHALTVRAFSKVVKNRPAAKLYIYGEGEKRRELVDLIKEEGLQDNVFLMGLTSDVKGVLAKAEVFVMASEFEGIPNAMLEAMAAGAPIVSTDFEGGGLPLLSEGGKNCVVVPRGDVDGMANAVISLLSDKKEREKYSQNAKSRACSFGSDVVFGRWLEYFKEVIKK